MKGREAVAAPETETAPKTCNVSSSIMVGVRRFHGGWVMDTTTSLQSRRGRTMTMASKTFMMAEMANPNLDFVNVGLVMVKNVVWVKKGVVGVKVVVVVVWGSDQIGEEDEF